MNKNKGMIGLGLIVAIVLGIIVVGGGVYYLKNKKTENKEVAKAEQNLLEYKTPCEISAISKKSFSFSYPEGYSITEIKPEEGNVPLSGIMEITIQPNDNSGPIRIGPGFEVCESSGITLCKNIGDIYRISTNNNSESSIYAYNKILSTIKTVSDCKVSPNTQPVSSSSITVLSPNGGETYKDSDKIIINWKGTAKENTAIYLRSSDGGWCFIKNVPTSVSSYIFNPSQYNCSNGKTILGGQYKVALISYNSNDMVPEPGTAFAENYKDGDGAIYNIDSSDNYFTINSSAVPTTTDSKTYSNNDYGFSFNYPDGYLLNENNNGGFFNELNIFELSIIVPSGYQKGTDFNTGRVDVIVSPSIAKCYSTDYVNEDMNAIKEINGKSFHYNPKQPFPDNAMGGLRGLGSLFSIIENGKCFRIAKQVAYRDLHGFSDPPYPPHYDEQKLNTDLDNIISTFKFLYYQ